jgi:hypothetical protein
MTTTKKTTRIGLECENGHQQVIVVWESIDGRKWYFDEDGPDETRLVVSRESYAYRNGGCCYQAARDAAADVSS